MMEKSAIESFVGIDIGQIMVAICEVLAFSLQLFATSSLTMDNWQHITFVFRRYFIKSVVDKSALESFVIDIGQIYGIDLRKS